MNTPSYPPPEPITGSYTADDCQFLLTPIKSEFTTIEDKERLIQSGQLHYSELIHQESAPTQAYTQLFLQLTAQYKQRLAAEIMTLAKLIAERRQGHICLVSLARAGTPIGVLLKRALQHHLGRSCSHYSISIIRDRGIDTVALDYLLQQGHADTSLAFIDGWTAKGVITQELKQAIGQYNSSHHCKIPDQLFVVSDIGGTADVAATYADYTLPSALMNSTVSGLVSRSILNSQVRPGQFHGCIRYDHLTEHDRSVWFIEQIAAQMSSHHSLTDLPGARTAHQARHQAFLDQLQQHYNVSDINRIKPGIAEATRVMLRRVPDLLLLKNPQHEDVAHLVQLSEEKGIRIIERPDMPFGACALIKDVTREAAR